MPFVPVPDVAQIELIWDYDGQRCENVLHYYSAAGWPVGNLTAACEDAVAKVAAWNQTIITNTMSLIQVIGTDLTTATSARVEYGTGLPDVMGGTTNPAPNNVALVFTKRTDQRGRSYRGRIYACGFLASGVEGNNISSAHLAILQSNWDSFLTISDGSVDVDMVVVSRRTNGGDRAEGIHTPVVALTTDGVVDSQRRRLPGRGA